MSFLDSETNREELKAHPATDFSLPENQPEKQKLIQQVILPVIQQRLNELYVGMNTHSEGEGYSMDYSGMSVEITAALNDPMTFVKQVCASSLKHFDAAAMIRNDILTQAEAKQLIDNALLKLGKNRSDFQNLT